jgi:hypothetical protein
LVPKLICAAGVGFESAAAMNVGCALFLVFNSKQGIFGFKAVLTKELCYGSLYSYIKEGVNKMWTASHKLAFPLCTFFLCDVSFTGKRFKSLVKVITMVIVSRIGRPRKGMYTLALHQQLQLSWIFHTQSKHQTSH